MGRAPGLRLQPSWGSGRDFLPAWGPGHASSHPWTDNAAQLRGPRTLSPPPAPPPRKPGLLAADSVPTGGPSPHALCWGCGAAGPGQALPWSGSPSRRGRQVPRGGPGGVDEQRPRPRRRDRWGGEAWRPPPWPSGHGLRPGKVPVLSASRTQSVPSSAPVCLAAPRMSPRLSSVRSGCLPHPWVWVPPHGPPMWTHSRFLVPRWGGG